MYIVFTVYNVMGSGKSTDMDNRPIPKIPTGTIDRQEN